MSPLRKLHEGREPRPQALLLGHIRLGVFTGKHPQESPNFIFTSSDRQRLEPLARDFGGKIAEYSPQGMGQEGWRLQSESDSLTALFPFANLEANVDQAFELFGRGGLKRACDGFDARIRHVDEVTGEITEEEAACVCEAQGKLECATTTRLHLLLPQTGLGIWLLTTHSKIAAIHLWDQARFVSQLAQGRMNHLPVRLVWAPRTISYFDEKEGKRRTTTKRVVAISIAGDAERALSPLGLAPDRGLIQAVRLALEDAGTKQLSAGATVGGSADEGASVQEKEPPTTAPRGRRKAGGHGSSGGTTPKDPAHPPATATPKARYDAAVKTALDAGVTPPDMKKQLVRLARANQWRWKWPPDEQTTDEQLEAMAKRLEELADEAAQEKLEV